VPLAENVASQIAGAIARSQLNAKAIQLSQERELRARLEAEKNELARVSEAKSEFLSTVSHELKTPLATILGFTDVLAANRQGNLTPRQVEQLGLIQRNGRRLGVLINDLVDVAGIQAGRFDIDPQEFDAVELLNEVARSFAPIVDARRQNLAVRFPAGSVRVSADRGRLAQVMANLLSNASKYSPEESQIDFEADVVGYRLMVMVRDRGAGIREADQRRLFTSFFRARNEATRSAPGTGLGLVICKRIIDLHGGSIDVDSAEGAGTVMRFQVPGVVTAAQPSRQVAVATGAVLEGALATRT
jgi:signal transduction histidine kinase